MRTLLFVGILFCLTACENSGDGNVSNLTSGANPSSHFNSQSVTNPAFTLQANMGPIFVDAINSPNGTIAGCAQGRLQRDCLKDLWARYVSEGVTGVRFMFNLNDNGFPFNSDGSPNQSWLNNMATVFSDMKSAGLTNITPTPNWAGWNAPQVISVFDSCQNKQINLEFYKATPYGFDTSNHFPYDLTDNNSYNCSPANPIFVGWTNIYNLLDGVIARAQSSGLNIFEFDIQNEINITWFPVQARLVYDTMHASTGDPNVYAHVRTLLSNHGFNPGVATYSTSVTNVSLNKFDCLTAFGDSARIAGLSGLINAIQGKPFGHPSNFNVQNKLLCGGTTDGMAKTILAQPLPDVFDIHAYSCVETPTGTCDPGQEDSTFPDTNVLYNAMEDFLDIRGASNATFMLGETSSMVFQSPGISCEGQPIASNTSTQMIDALLTSRLMTSNNRTPALNVMRPWGNIYNACNGIGEMILPAWANTNVTPPPTPDPVISLSLSYAFPTVDPNEAKSYAVIKGTTFAPGGTNTVTSSCAGLEKVYDGPDGAGNPEITQINVRVPAQNLPFTCTFQVQRPDGSVSNVLTETMTALPMLAPIVSSAGAGCTACQCGWIVGTHLYEGAVDVDLRDSNWNIVGEVTSANLVHNGTTSMTFYVPSNLISEFESTGLRFTVDNTSISAWDTSDLVVCQP